MNDSKKVTTDWSPSLLWVWGYWSGMDGKGLQSAPFNSIRGVHQDWLDGYDAGKKDREKRVKK